jgi:hypothetical protein
MSIVVTTPVFETIVGGTMGAQGPAGAAGSSGSTIFILDIVPTSSGIVASKVYTPNTVPSNNTIESAISDTQNVRVLIGVEGGEHKYSPDVTINTVPAILTESSTKRWFTGYADIVLAPSGNTTITAVSNVSATRTATVTLSGAGPVVNSVTFGSYPGSQTELKSGDTIVATITVPADAVEVQVEASGASTTTYNKAVTIQSAIQNITISNASGIQSIRVRAKNSIGTYGEWFTSSTLVLNQTYPTIGSFSVSYPASQSAIKNTESATISSTVSNFDTISYTSSNLTVANSTTYEATKSVTYLVGSYVNAGTNYTISATRAANNATSTGSTLVVIADVAPTAAISITGNPTRLVSSPSGITYTIKITPSQVLLSAPSLNATLGTWTGSWTLSAGVWSRGLIISDATARGTGTFSGLSLVGLAGIAGNSITAGSTYTVGGLTMRNLTYPAYSRVTAIGSAVADQTKVSAQITGGNVLTRYTDNAVHTNGFYIANADGTYNPNGSYLGLSDSAFAGSNTSGTLTVDMQEAV